METLLSIILVVFSILHLILFFKIWGMTNDISKVRILLEIIIENYCMNNTCKPSTKNTDTNTNI